MLSQKLINRIKATPIPNWRWSLLVGLWLLWSTCTTAVMKRNAIIAGLCFAVIESVFTWLIDRKVKTTFAQFWIILMTFPFICEPFRALLEWPGWFDVAFRIAIFPFHCWILEIVQGYTLIFFYGRNVAWCYSDDEWILQRSQPNQLPNQSETAITSTTPSTARLSNLWRTGGDAFFHGNIKLGYFKYWWILGLIFEIGFFAVEYFDATSPWIGFPLLPNKLNI